VKVKPKVGDLVEHFHGALGIVKATRGIDVEIHWMGRLALVGDSSWHRRTSVKVISRA